MFNQKSRLSLAIAAAMGLAVAACSGASTSSAAVAQSTAPVAAATPAPGVAAPGTPGAGVSPAGEAAPAPVATAGAATPTAPQTMSGSVKPAGALPLLVVTKSPTCGCCHLWVEHMQKAGFQVEVHDVDDINLVKARVGVPYGKGSCHTAEVGGYFVEGHVPADDVKRLLAERPDAKGLTVPGMPMGSPGMEVPDGRVQPYAVELVGRDGTTSEFAHHGH